MKEFKLNPALSRVQRLQNYAMQINRATLGAEDGISGEAKVLMVNTLVIRVTAPNMYSIQRYVGRGKAFEAVTRFDVNYTEAVTFLDGMALFARIFGGKKLCSVA